jgi:hypothetical protein
MNEEQKTMALQVGVTVLILLAAMTIGEYFIGLFAPYWWAPLMAIALLKAFYIVRDYMHIGRVFAGDEAEEHS